jgi:hypothetical protein
VYIKEAYGKLIGFYTDGAFAVIQTGTIAAGCGFCQICGNARL